MATATSEKRTVERRQRSLTDADVDAIVNKLEERVTTRFYSDLGRGVWAYCKKMILLGMLAIAAYGAWNSGK